MAKLKYSLIFIICILLVPASKKLTYDLLYKFSNQWMQQLASTSFSNTIQVKTINFEVVRLNSISEIEWKNISGTINLIKKNDIFPRAIYHFHVTQAAVDLSRVFNGRVLLSIKGASFEPEQRTPSTQHNPGNFTDGLTRGRLSTEISIDLSKPKTIQDQLRQWRRQTNEIITEGRTKTPLNFSGIVSFQFRGQPARTQITTQKTMEGYFSLVLNQEIFKTLAWQMKEELTDAETKLLSTNPFKMKRLFAIMTEARAKSEIISKQKTLPDDAYRHVLWSYLLTKEFGPDFSKRITDAHEQGDMSNTEAAHRMDYANNAIGREYALKGYRENQILTKLLNDPRIIREPKESASP